MHQRKRPSLFDNPNGNVNLRKGTTTLGGLLNDPFWIRSMQLRMSMNMSSSRATTIFLFAMCILTRLILGGLYGYSGMGVGPRFGDFEAQRHWMEIALHRNVSQWYDDDGGGWWSLDYPPLSGWWAWGLGKVSSTLLGHPEWTAWESSRGFESDGLKVFMRLSVILIDLVLFIPAVLWATGGSEAFKPSLWLWILTCPVLLLIDHGHFQYNNAMLALSVLAWGFLHRGRLAWATVMHCLAISFKQMALYYHLPLSFALLHGCWVRGKGFR